MLLPLLLLWLWLSVLLRVWQSEPEVSKGSSSSVGGPQAKMRNGCGCRQGARWPEDGHWSQHS